ncbi:hypothetical protein, partial [Roseibium sp.]|uniref:hypothetical protein n=1 Tax=Roseibium sp. TaxID=1936156 RepID=UPI003A9779E8
RAGLLQHQNSESKKTGKRQGFVSSLTRLSEAGFSCSVTRTRSYRTRLSPRSVSMAGWFIWLAHR